MTVRYYSDTQCVIVCKCGHYHNHNIPCRHIYAVFNVEPAAFHCGIREQKKFEAFYDKDETTINYTNEWNRILAMKLRGPLLELPLITRNDNDGTSSVPFQQFNSPLQRCCPINPVVVEKGNDENNTEEKEAEMNEHGFGNVFDRYNDDDDCDNNGFASTMENDDDDAIEFNPSKSVSNGYMVIQPLVKECSRMITDEGKLAIANKYLTGMREELYRASNKDVSKKKVTKQQWWNEITSSM